MDHRHCWWCGHVLKPSCGEGGLARVNEPYHPLCRARDHDCHAEATRVERNRVELLMMAQEGE